jgi:hypothetical protein
MEAILVQAVVAGIPLVQLKQIVLVRLAVMELKIRENNVMMGI